MAEEKKRVPTGVIVGLGAASAAAIGIGLWLLTRRPEEPEPPEPGRANLYGVVIDTQTKKGIPGAMVTLASIVIYTDSSGAYIHEDIMPGSYTVSFDAEGYESKQLSVYLAEGNNELDVELIPVGLEAEFHCGVWDSVSLAPVVNALVRLEGVQTRECRVNDFGDCSFYDLPAGSYTITITMTDYLPHQETINIPAGRSEREFYIVYQETPGMEGLEVRWIDGPASVYQGESFMFRVQVVNESGHEGDFGIVMTVNGISFTRVAHIEYPGFEVVMFDGLVVDTPGEYNICCGGECQPLIVSEVITGTFCCPLCGCAQETVCTEEKWVKNGWWHKECIKYETRVFDTTQNLSEHMISRCPVDIKTWGAVPTPCYRLHVYCPICGDYFDVKYCKEWGRRSKTEVPALLSHIQGRHGLDSLYCENVPEGGYKAGPYG